MDDAEKYKLWDLEAAEEEAKPKRTKLRVCSLGLALIGFIFITISIFREETLNFFKGKPSHDQLTKSGQVKVSFENVRNGTFAPAMKSLQWINAPGSISDDKGLFLTNANDGYEVRSVFDKDFSRILWKGKSFVYKNTNYSVDSLVASPNLEQLLIRTKTVSNWRHSSFGSYFVYSNSTGFQCIGDHLSLAEWSPNSLDIAYVHDNDLYLYSTEESKTVDRITQDGGPQLFNGKPDWVYEEEVMETDRTLWWSPKGDYLAFYKINETQVGEFVIPYYVQEPEDVYSKLKSIKYPKSGTPNPVAAIVLYDLKKGKASQVELSASPDLLIETKWVGDRMLLVKSTDRSSDVLTVHLVDAEEKESKVVRKESSNGGWWEITHNTLYVPQDKSKGRESDGYLDVLPVNGFNHLVYFASADDFEPVILTRGAWEIEDGPFSFDQETNNVYFIAAKKASTQRHLYSVSLQNPEKVVEITDTSKSAVYSATFSSGSRFVLISYKGPDVPFQKIVDLKSDEQDVEKEGNIVGKTLYYLTKNEELRRKLASFAIPSKKVQELALDDGVTANSFEILPNDFDSQKRDHYPVFFYAYGGPNSQQILETFSVGFLEVVASQLNALVVVVDGRGTGFKGKEFRSVVRDHLGDYEARDQISAASLYASKPFVNADKISLFGWSYGGYLTLKTLEKDAGAHFKYGVAVAPVTDWRFYDSVYTERYMHTPQQNTQGYVDSSVHNVTAIAQAQRFLLMHGTGDDNVHFQNSLKVLDMLDLNGIENYDVHVFPDSDHSIRYHNANTIVWDKILNWTKKAYFG